MSLAQRLLERRVQLLGRDLALLEVELHQRFVDFHHLIDQGAMRFGDRREIRFAGGVEKTVDHALAAVGGKIDRQAFLAERGLDGAQNLLRVSVFRVNLVDDHQAAKPALRRPFHHARGDHFDACLRVDHDGSGLDCVERSDRLTDEVRKTGRVEKMHPRTIDVEMHDGRA